MNRCKDQYIEAYCTNNIVRKFPNGFINHVIHGNCVDILNQMPDDCIDLVITSPPYFVEKNYEKDWTIEDYNILIASVFKECFRILRPGRYFVVNFGDYFNRNRFYESEIPSVYPAAIKFFEWGRLANFDLQSTRIWRKRFAKMSIPFVCNSHPRPIFDYEHIWTYRKPDGTGKEFVNNRKKSQVAVLGDGWSSSAQLVYHEASFPIELPLWAIDVYSKKQGEIVLDPFCGIGTTLVASTERYRKFIGVDLNKEYCDRSYLALVNPMSLSSPKTNSKKTKKKIDNKLFEKISNYEKVLFK